MKFCPKCYRMVVVTNDKCDICKGEVKEVKKKDVIWTMKDS